MHGSSSPCVRETGVALWRLAGATLATWEAAAIDCGAHRGALTTLAELQRLARTDKPIVIAGRADDDVMRFCWAQRTQRRAAPPVIALLDGSVACSGDSDSPDRAWSDLTWDVQPVDASLTTAKAATRAAIEEACRRIAEVERVGETRERRQRLTAAEEVVLVAVCAGKLNKQIAREQGVSVRTIEQRRSKMFAKMGIDSAAPLAVACARLDAYDAAMPQRSADASTPTRAPVPAPKGIGSAIAATLHG